MKILSIILLILAVSPFSSCAQTEDIDVIGFSYIYGAGDGESVKLIGPDTNSILQVYNSDLGYNNTILVTPYVLNRKAINYISKYIRSHCNEINHTTSMTRDWGYWELIVHGKSQLVCYLVNKDEIKSYTEGLIRYIEQSPYKKECRKLLDGFKTIANWKVD